MKTFYCREQRNVEAAKVWIDEHWEKMSKTKNPLQIECKPETKKRKLTMNDAMWAGPLKDIEEQAIHEGKKYAAKVWHEYLKEMFLPDEVNDFGFDPTWVLSGYQKWGINPFNGQRRLLGSTTQLTDKGMSIYLLQVESHMSSRPYCVRFTERIEPQGRP